MNVLVIGGTGFIGPPLVRELQALGHKLAVFHRGRSEAALPPSVELILGDRANLDASRQAFQRLGPDVVIDLILSSGPQAEALMRAFRGRTRRVVAASSIDIYRAFAIVQGLEPGPLEALPLTEDSPLRRAQPLPPPVLKAMQAVFSWVDDAYGKVPVEMAILSEPELPGVVLRLPMIYGPGDRLHRLFPLLKRMDDGRRRILFSEEQAAWVPPRGYVENVAHAIALAATSERAAGRVYNVAEEPALSELDWAKAVAAQTGWRGELVVLPRERMPEHLRPRANFAQHVVASSERIRRELGYREQIPLDEAIRHTIAWERANPPAQIPGQQFDYAAEGAAQAA